MSRKIILILVVLLSLSACAGTLEVYSPGIADSALPTDFLVQKAREEGIEYPSLEDIYKIEIITPEYPSGDYILVQLLSGGEYQSSIFFQGKYICSWEQKTSYPPDFQVKELLYFTPDNCPGCKEQYGGICTIILLQNLFYLGPIWIHIY